MSKLYSFTHSYLSDIQKGIQTAHLVSELYLKYLAGKDLRRSFDSEDVVAKVDNWMKSPNPTIVAYKAGNSGSLRNIFGFLKDNFDYPFVEFTEGEDSLNNSITAVGIILPWQFSSEFRDNLVFQNKLDTKWDRDMVQLLNRSILV